MDDDLSGTMAETGSFRCDDCGYLMTLVRQDALPDACPGCGGLHFSRASMFASALTMVRIPPPPPDPARSALLRSVADDLAHPGSYLVFEREDDGVTPAVHLVSREWTRIGRSLAADVRFDDPTVSRRHALIVRQPDGLRVLDDRSLNGVFVNGRRIEWRQLRDGDEIAVGCHRLHYVETVATRRRLPVDGADDRGALAEGRYGQDDDRAPSHGGLS